MFVTTCRPSKNINTFLTANIFIKNCIKFSMPITIFNKNDEFPESLKNYDFIKIDSGFNELRPSLNYMVLNSNEKTLVYCNSDIEFDMLNFKKVFEFFNSSEYSIASSRRYDYQWDKKIFKKQSLETMDIFFIKTLDFVKINPELLIPGTIKFDNLLIHSFFNNKLKILNFSHVFKIFHKNHENFKINGFFNFIISKETQKTFQNLRKKNLNIKFGSLAYGDICYKKNNSFKIKESSLLIKFFIYYLGRFKVLLFNKIELFLSAIILMFSREINKLTTYKYFLIIYLPKSNENNQDKKTFTTY